MKKNKAKKSNMDNFFNEMSYEMAGDIGAIDNEDMISNKKLNRNETLSDKSKSKE